MTAGMGTLANPSVGNANVDLSGSVYRFVKRLSTGLIDLTTAAADLPVGVLFNKPKAGEAVNCFTVDGGIVKMIWDGVAGTPLVPGVALKLSAASPGAVTPTVTATDKVVAVLEDANGATAVGHVITAQLKGGTL